MGGLDGVTIDDVKLTYVYILMAIDDMERTETEIEMVHYLTEQSLDLRIIDIIKRDLEVTECDVAQKDDWLTIYKCEGQNNYLVTVRKTDVNLDSSGVDVTIQVNINAKLM